MINKHQSIFWWSVHRISDVYNLLENFNLLTKDKMKHPLVGTYQDGLRYDASIGLGNFLKQPMEAYRVTVPWICTSIGVRWMICGCLAQTLTCLYFWRGGREALKWETASTFFTNWTTRLQCVVTATNVSKFRQVNGLSESWSVPLRRKRRLRYSPCGRRRVGGELEHQNYIIDRRNWQSLETGMSTTLYKRPFCYFWVTWCMSFDLYREISIKIWHSIHYHWGSVSAS